MSFLFQNLQNFITQHDTTHSMTPHTTCHCEVRSNRELCIAALYSMRLPRYARNDKAVKYCFMGNTSFVPPSANQLQPKSAKTMQAMCGSKGIANFAEAKAIERTQ
jgi:hypothetical protein